MKKPPIKDKAVEKYVNYLEQQLSNFKSETTLAKLYLGQKKQLDDLAELLLKDEHLMIKEDGVTEVKVKLMSTEALQDKDDKFYDRTKDLLKDSLKYAENLEGLESKVNPEILDKVKKEEFGGDLEEAISTKNG